jgi:hypothetical protein
LCASGGAYIVCILTVERKTAVKAILSFRSCFSSFPHSFDPFWPMAQLTKWEDVYPSVCDARGRRIDWHLGYKRLAAERERTGTRQHNTTSLKSNVYIIGGSFDCIKSLKRSKFPPKNPFDSVDTEKIESMVCSFASHFCMVHV